MMNTWSHIAFILLITMIILTSVTVAQSYNITHRNGILTRYPVSTDAHYLWTDSLWYRILIVCIEFLSLNSVMKTFNKYQIDHAVSKYVKHYLVCLIMNLLLRLSGKMCIFADRYSDYVEKMGEQNFNYLHTIIITIIIIKKCV